MKMNIVLLGDDSQYMFQHKLLVYFGFIVDCFFFHALNYDAACYMNATKTRSIWKL